MIEIARENDQKETNVDEKYNNATCKWLVREDMICSHQIFVFDHFTFGLYMLKEESIFIKWRELEHSLHCSLPKRKQECVCRDVYNEH